MAPPPTNSVFTQTAPQQPLTSTFPTSSARTYAEAVTQTQPPVQKGKPRRPPPPKGKKEESSPKGKRPPAPPPPAGKQPTTKAIVVRALPTKYKVGELRRWIKEDNKDLVITGARWLLAEDRRPGKTHSSLVLYLSDSPETPRLRMGRKSFHTTAYDWDRPPRSQPRP